MMLFAVLMYVMKSRGLWGMAWHTCACHERTGTAQLPPQFCGFFGSVHQRVPPSLRRRFVVVTSSSSLRRRRFVVVVAFLSHSHAQYTPYIVHFSHFPSL